MASGYDIAQLPPGLGRRRGCDASGLLPPHLPANEHRQPYRRDPANRANSQFWARKIANNNGIMLKKISTNRDPQFT